jgi:muconolactone delta-isomerase
VAGDDAATTTWRRRAEAALADIADADDREVIEQDLASIP